MAHSLDISQMSRREFLRLGSASLLSLLYISKPTYAYAKSLAAQETSASLGRVTTNLVNMYDQPSLDGKLLRTLWQDLVLPITQVTISTSEPAYNRTWYQLNGEGFVHSGSVQPVAINLNEAISSAPEKGVLGEVTVPYTDAVWNPLFKKLFAHRLYFSTTHWILDVLVDAQGQTWYELLEDFYQFKYYINASHMRVITEDETTPLSPSVPASDKRLEVWLNHQIVIAYEGDNQVQMIRCSGGMKYFNKYLTPTGAFTTDYKRPSRHMVAGSKADANSYDLPGVPWVCYIDEKGVSFHGTFWHNDFGKPRSHGCINLPSAGAKWVYRWTLPSVPFTDSTVHKLHGTTVRVSM